MMILVIFNKIAKFTPRFTFNLSNYTNQNIWHVNDYSELVNIYLNKLFIQWWTI